MLNILKVIHAFLGLNAIAAGIPVCIRMVLGRHFNEWVAHFLRISLAASAIGLILSIDHTDLVQWLTILGVYTSAFAVMSWRKVKSNEEWKTALVLGTMSVLCLDSLVAIVHVFKLLLFFSIVLGWSPPDSLFPISLATAVLLFAVLSIVAVKKNHQEISGPVIYKATQ